MRRPEPDIGRPDKDKLHRERKLVKAGIGISTIFCVAASIAKPEAAPALMLAASAVAVPGGIHLALTDPWQN